MSTLRLQAPAAFQLETGEWFDVLDPDHNLIQPEMLARVLSRIPRFGGHAPRHYSVAQHSVFVWCILAREDYGPEVAMAGLLHDAPEALGIGDIIGPVKHHLGPDVYGIEARLATAVEQRFDLGRRLDDEAVRAADSRAYCAETIAIRGAQFLEYMDADYREQAYADIDRYGDRLGPLQPEAAATHWIEVFHATNNRRNF